MPFSVLAIFKSFFFHVTLLCLTLFYLKNTEFQVQKLIFQENVKLIIKNYF